MEFFSTFQFKKFFSELYDKAFDTDVFNHSAQVAFYFSFSFFPLLLFLMSVFGLILESTDTLRQELFIYLAQIMPGSAYDLVQKTLDEIVETGTGGKLTLGLAVTLWSASAGVDSLRSSLNAVYELKEGRSWWHTKLQSLVMTLLFILLIAVAVAGVTSGWKAVQSLLGGLGLEITSPLILVSIQWGAIIVIMMFATGVIYSWLPCFKKFKWVWISSGALVAIILWIALTAGFRVYLQFFNTYNKAYGSLGAVIILMLWMYLTAMAILIGGAINSVLTEMAEADENENQEKAKLEKETNIPSPS